MTLKKKELRLLAKERINEIETLKEEAKSKDKLLNHLLDGEYKMSKLLTDLEYEKHYTLHDIVELELKLLKLEISSAQIDRIKESVL